MNKVNIIQNVFKIYPLSIFNWVPFNRLFLFRSVSTFVVVITFSFFAHSVDVVKIKKQKIFKNKAAHNFELVQRALEVTEDEYGSFTFEEVFLPVNNDRLLKTVADGNLVNIALVPANKEWDSTNIPIRIPVRLGLLNYRLLVINKTSLASFKDINSEADLNKFSAGLMRNWVTTEIYKSNELNVVDVTNFDGLFPMLSIKRFDYIPRTVYEIYEDKSTQNFVMKNLVIEPTIALNIPMYTYIYVSSKELRLAKRFELGLTKLLASGELTDLLYKYYGADIRRANLNGRKIIYIENSMYDAKIKVSAEDLFH